MASESRWLLGSGEALLEWARFRNSDNVLDLARFDAISVGNCCRSLDLVRHVTGNHFIFTEETNIYG